MVTPVDSVKYYMKMINYLQKELGRRIIIIQRRTYKEMDILIEKGEVDAAFICSGSYVKDKEKFGAEIIAVPQYSGKPFYYSYIIVNKESPIKEFNDLRGKSFAFTDPRSNTGKLFPTYLLLKKSIIPEKFFRRYIFTYSHNKSIEMVAKRIVDGAAVDSLVYDYGIKRGFQYTKMTKVILKSPPFGSPPIVSGKNTALEMKRRLREILLNMHKNKEGKAILEVMGIDKFVAPDYKNYDSIRKMDMLISTNNINIPISNKGSKKLIRFGILPEYNPRILY
jgi:phosphonate transport system substrate-binding protein